MEVSRGHLQAPNPAVDCKRDPGEIRLRVSNGFSQVMIWSILGQCWGNQPALCVQKVGDFSLLEGLRTPPLTANVTPVNSARFKQLSSGYDFAPRSTNGP